jgi:gluconate 2-dehydrogenase gamma chain
MSQSNSDQSAKKGISRRSFLKLAGASLGITVSAAACEAMSQEEALAQPFESTPSSQEPPQNLAGPQDMPPPGVLGFFTPDEARTVEALTATLLPGTPSDPGAREAGVVYYIDALLWYDRGFGARTYYRPPFAMAYEGDSPPTNFTNGDVLWIPKDLMPRFGWQSILTPREFYRMGIMSINSYASANHGGRYADLTEEQQEEIMTALAEDEMDPIGGLDSSEFFDMLRDHTVEGMFSDPVYRGNRDMVGWKLISYPGAQRAYTPLEMQDEAYSEERDPQSIAMLHPFNAGEASHPNAILPVTGSGTPGVEPHDIYPHP